ncbi:MAG TPA: hypothetical protein DCR44_06535 [Acholeplasmatales bacterium]|nr:MAG: hypothetical protein A2Y16_00790 [Tenericutes bacterium GWF2_57_13]HAQ57035.1 hypothetical protein [Acholeplasmatales bacterium]
MATTIKDWTLKLRTLGLNVVKTIEKGVTDTRKGIEHTILENELRHRFNLENPYRFEIRDPKEKPNVLTGLAARNAKRYDEDDLFVLYGEPSVTGILAGNILKDLSNGAEYQVENVVSVTMGVTYQNKEHEVPATAVKCKAL